MMIQDIWSARYLNITDITKKICCQLKKLDFQFCFETS